MNLLEIFYITNNGIGSLLVFPLDIRKLFSLRWHTALKIQNQ